MERARDIAPRSEKPDRRDAVSKSRGRPGGETPGPEPTRDVPQDEPRSLFLRLRPERRRRFSGS